MKITFTCTPREINDQDKYEISLYEIATKININIEIFETHCKLEYQDGWSDKNGLLGMQCQESINDTYTYTPCSCTGILNPAQLAFTLKKSMVITKKSL